MGLSCILWTCYTDQRAETWLITQNLKQEKSSKENGSIVISKDDRRKLSWYQKHVLVLNFLDHGDTVC
jgi:hypothetical protein